MADRGQFEDYLSNSAIQLCYDNLPYQCGYWVSPGNRWPKKCSAQLSLFSGHSSTVI